MRWLLDHRRAFRGRSISGADRRSDPRCFESAFLCQPPDLAPWLREIQMDIGAESLEGRDVDHPRFVGERAVQTFAEQLIERVEEGRQGLSRASRRRDEAVSATTNRFPAQPLRGSGFAKTLLKPAGNNGMERGQRHR